MLSIKNARPADIPLIRDLAMQIWPQTYTPIIGEQQVAYMLELFYSPKELRRQMKEPGHQFIICYNDGQPVAFAAYSQIVPQMFKLHKLYILPGEQGKGIGKFMLGHIISDIKSKNAVAFIVNVNRHNHTAIGFYLKAGFRKLVDEDIRIGNGYFMNDHVLSMEFAAIQQFSEETGEPSS